MKGSFWGGLRVPNNRLSCMHGQKTLSFSYMHLYFYLICSTTPKRFAQLIVFPNPSFAWSYSAAIGRCQCLWLWAVLVCVQPLLGKRLVLTLQKRHQVGGNMLMFHFDVNMRRLKIRLRTTRFNDSESTLYIERIELYTRYTFRFNTCLDVFIQLEPCYTLHESYFPKSIIGAL